MRAGTGAPEAGKGYEGDVYIDIATADVYLFREGEWTLVGNIRTSAAENLTGATGAAGAAGETGATGAAGASGAPGAPGTQLTLGLGAPANDTCTTDGDVYIDTEVVAFYECSSGAWVLFNAPARRNARAVGVAVSDPGGLTRAQPACPVRHASSTIPSFIR